MTLYFCGLNSSDLWRAAKGPTLHCVTSTEAFARAGAGDGILLLADQYPAYRNPVDWEQVTQAVEQGVRLYVEYPSSLPEIGAGSTRRAKWYERAVVTDRSLNPELTSLQILALNDCHHIEYSCRHGHLALARVAGFEQAVFGLPEHYYTLLYSACRDNVLIAATGLSHFVTGRYAPMNVWRELWQGILAWLDPAASPRLAWTPAVRPSVSQTAPLAPEAEERAIRNALDWYYHSRLLVHTSWSDAVEQAQTQDLLAVLPEDRPIGDGTHGILEGYDSRILHNGRQRVRCVLRYDCMSESAMALAFGARLFRDKECAATSARLGRYIYADSVLARGPRSDRMSSSYGLISWSTEPPNDGVYYGDDNARGVLAGLACSALLADDTWNARILRCILANFRTSGTEGFRRQRVEETPLADNGWQHYFQQSERIYAPHYESYLWACFLYAYQQIGYKPLLDRARCAIELMMSAYPDQWVWTNGLMQERARMLLPLAWLVRVDPRPRYRRYLERICTDIISRQHASGAICEELGAEAMGRYKAAASNEAYGVSEAPLIQNNGDPLADMLYTVNFAYLGLHEAQAVLQDKKLADALVRLTDFLCRIQVQSEERPELAGAWFRAFDCRRWEYWGSSGDIGWGAWSIESGWTVGWLTAVLALRQLDTTLWDLLRPLDLQQYAPAELAALALSGSDPELA